MIQLFYKFLNKIQNNNNNFHVLLVTKDSDFQLVTNKMKKYKKVKTHVMTSVVGNYFYNGLADMVLFYERAFSNTPTPNRSTPRNSIQYPPPKTPEKKRKNDANDKDATSIQSQSKKRKSDQDI